MTLMFQKEVADRLVAPPGSKARGRLSILAQWRAEVRRCFDLPPGAFTPAPKVALQRRRTDAAFDAGAGDHGRSGTNYGARFRGAAKDAPPHARRSPRPRRARRHAPPRGTDSRGFLRSRPSVAGRTPGITPSCAARTGEFGAGFLPRTPGVAVIGSPCPTGSGGLFAARCRARAGAPVGAGAVRTPDCAREAEGTPLPSVSQGVFENGAAGRATPEKRLRTPLLRVLYQYIFSKVKKFKNTSGTIGSPKQR